MKQQRFETDKSPHITVTNCQADLVVSGWQAAAVEVEGTEFQAQMETLNNVTLTAVAAVAVKLPALAQLTIVDATGSVVLKHIDGHVTIKRSQGTVSLKSLASVKIHSTEQQITAENVDGPLTILTAGMGVELRNVGPLQIENVGGDLTVRNVNGSVDVGHVTGTTLLQTVSGDLALSSTGGDVNLSNLGGGTAITGVGGGIRLNGGLASGEHSLTAVGDIIVRWPVDAPLLLTASAAELFNRLPLEAQAETTTNGTTTLTGTIAEAGSHLRLQTPARIGLDAVLGLTPGKFDAADFDFDFTKVISAPPASTAAVSKSDALLPPDLARLSDKLITDTVNLILTIMPGADIDLIERQVSETVLAALVAYHKRPSSDAASRPSKTKASIDAERAKQAVEASLQKAKDSISQAGKRLQPTKTSGGSSSKTAAPARPTRPAAGETMASEEQRHILHLLEEGHITVEQAQTLLKALKL